VLLIFSSTGILVRTIDLWFFSLLPRLPGSP
jgi:hypothetical protein